MRADKDFMVFASHFDWYTTKKGVGYVPTDKAPKEAVEAMERCNRNTKCKEELRRKN